MDLRLVSEDVYALETGALVVFEAEGGRRPDLAKSVSTIYDAGEITGKYLEFTLLHKVAGFKAERVLVAGTGKPEKWSSSALRKLTAAAIRFLKSKRIKNIAIALNDEMSTPDSISAIAESLLTAPWEPDRLKTDKEGDTTIESATIIVSGDPGSFTKAFEHGRAIGEAVNLSRDISVSPPNLLTPGAMAERARAVALEAGLAIDILDRDRMRQLGMGALLAVAQGSAEAPAMIVMRYKPANPTSAAHLGLIGKGVTFDTGGISIKPSEGMEKMKYDMAGGAAVIAAMQAIARLKPDIAVTGIVPAVENMPGGRALRPSDIITSLSGKTIEVLNTDAEGRLILADAITYAKTLGCSHLVDAATLTGAIVVALGTASSGVFASDEALLAQWMSAAAKAGEKMWRMPLDDEYREQLKTVYADIQNIGGRGGGACSAAMFLKEFVGDTPWIHVDVAGTAWLDDAKPHLAKGPTGTPLGTFVNLALNWKT
ncbi:MAG: leucyl aminopeptidase [Terriglobia bacterium]